MYITFDEVVMAAEEIKQSGDKPTIEKVRLQLGSRGSNSTISKHLYMWRQQSVTDLHITRKAEAPHVVQVAMESAWHGLREQADAEIKKIKEETEKEILQAHNQMHQAEESLSVLTREHTRLMQYLNEISSQKELLVLDLKKIRDEYSLLQERHQSLEERHIEMQETASRHLETISETHKNEIKRLAKLNQQQNDHYKKLADEIKDQYERDRHQQIAQFDSVKIDLHKKDKIISDLEAVIKNQDIKLAKLETENKTLKSESNTLLSRIEEQDKTWKNFSEKSLVSDELISKINLFPEINSYIEKFDSKLFSKLDDKFFEFKSNFKNFELLENKDKK